MGRITIYLSREQEALIDNLVSVSGCSRYQAVKGLFEVGTSTIAFVIDSRKLLITHLKKVHSKQYKDKSPTK